MESSLRRALRMVWFLLWLLGWMGIPLAPGFAQQDKSLKENEKIPIQVGNYDISGTVSFGNRFVDVSGSRAKYNELLNLHAGFRVFDTQLEVLRSEPNRGWLDRFSLTTQNLGGDPFPAIRLDVHKNGLYELRAGYRATQYFYNLPQTDFTPNRGWLDRRRFADADLRYTPWRNLAFRFFYNRTEREGNESSTGPFFYFPIGTDIWGAFGRADRVPWVIPLREEANLFGGGIDFRFRKTDVHVEQSYRTYNNPANLKGFSDRPIQLLGPNSPAQNLVVTRWDAFAGLNNPMTSLRVDQEVTNWLRLRAGYLYQHASGPTSLDGAVRVPLPATPDAPSSSITTNYIGAGTTNMTSHTSEAGFTLKLFEALDLVSDYRYQTLTQTGEQSVRASRSDLPAPVPLGDDTLRWDFGLHTLDTLFAYVPHSTLSLRAGLRFSKQDVVYKTDGRIAPGTRRSWFYTPVVNVSWKPSKKLRLTGQFEHRTAVDPYVRISPESGIGSSIRARFSPNERWGIDNTFSFRNQETELQDFRMRSRTNSTNAWYQPLARLGLNAGFTYGSFSSRNTIRYLRGTPPLSGLLSTDQTIDRSYFWGVRTQPVRNVTLSFSGQFIRSTGLGTFSGETSTYGPLTWPAWDAAIAYQTKSAGRLVFSWQRSYYFEDLTRTTDFSANAFRMGWDFSF